VANGLGCDVANVSGGDNVAGGWGFDGLSDDGGGDNDGKPVKPSISNSGSKLIFINLKYTIICIF
jgi:hypothetical protein